ncbi:MAG: Recombinase [Candidatus Peregrinibacteria bacterium Gr01-1014_25]|nr:MAG: Recombinase [Candidatus Peregrinibacteria bacterium Gr01-1014_25]
MPSATLTSPAETKKIPKPTATKYCLYARKSSEEDSRQALSIDSQVKEMLALAKRDGLDIVEIRRESHSAKESGQRPVFEQLIADIRLGKFTGILTWSPDRLGRNAGDLGSIVDLMDQGFLHVIRTHGQSFTNNPNEKFLLMILGSQAKLENDNRGLNVKRGQKTRAEMGYRPCMAPLGYLHERPAGESRSRVVVDPVRGHVIARMFEHAAYNGASGRTIAEWLRNEKFRTRTGKMVSISMIYRMLRNSYYTGRYEFPRGNGVWHKGDYEPLVTQELFNEVQKLLALGPKPVWGSKSDNFAFTKMMTCGACRSGITAEEKHKKLADGAIRRYVYYRCTHSKDLHCKEPSIREEQLIEQLAEMIDKIDLDISATKKRIQAQYEYLQKFSTGVLGITGKQELPKVDMKKYALFVLKNGSNEEKRELINHINSRLTLAGGRIIDCSSSKS